MADRPEALWARSASPMRRGYDALALVSLPRHLDALDPADPTILVVCTEWMAWQIARERGFDAVHVEAVTDGWPQEHGPSGDVYLNGCAWLLEGDEDPTLYRGVSLGRLYGTYLAMAWQAAAGYDAALRRLCRDHAPSRLILFDLSAHFGVLRAPAKRRLAAEVARDVQCVVDDRLDEASTADPAMHHRTESFDPRLPGPPGWRDRLRGLLAALVEHLFRLRLAGRANRPRVFLYISLLSLRRMVEDFDRADLVPLIPFAASPKDRGFLGACWRGGLWPVRMDASAAAERRAAAEAEIRAALAASWQARPARGLDAVHRESVAALLFPTGILAQLAETVDRLAAVLDRFGVDRVVSGDVSSPIGRALCELAHGRGIPVDETLNGVFVAPMGEPTRCGQGRVPAMVTRQLAFGPATQPWLRSIGSPMASVITGYPGLGRPRPGQLTLARRGTALVLPGYAWVNDLDALRADIFPMVVAVVRALERLGFAEIRIRIHPGVDNPAFYALLIEHFRLAATVSLGGGFAEQIDWADAVIGPAGSSAFLETLAAGKPYYVLRPPPSCIEDAMLPGAVVADSAEALEAALAEGRVPDRERLLDYWCAVDRIDRPGREIWRAIAQGLDDGKRAA